jgi:hypothetical protein
VGKAANKVRDQEAALSSLAAATAAAERALDAERARSIKLADELGALETDYTRLQRNYEDVRRGCGLRQKKPQQ